jgi:DNA-binding NarL/FixJ family response regulator
MARIIIADDHQLVAEGLKAIIESGNEHKVIAVAMNGSELIKQLELVQPELLLLDVDMPVMNGIEAMQLIQKNYPELKVIVLSMHEEKSLVKKFVDMGACGFLIKNTDQDELLMAIKRIIGGGQYFSSALTMNMMSHNSAIIGDEVYDSKKAMLTGREIEILKLIAEGYSNKEIGDKLFISHRTVDTHRTNLMKKLEVTNIAGLIRYAIKSGFSH